MLLSADRPETPAAIRTDLGAIFISLELSKSTWLITALAPGSEKMSRHSVAGGDLAGLFACFSELRRKAQARQGQLYPLVVIQEAGLDGFWIDRVLNQEDWIESHVVDAASIAVSRRHRRAKTDRIDGEALIRTLMAYKRGEPRVCSMVRVPAIEDEDRRRICRERKALVAERISHVNRIVHAEWKRCRVGLDYHIAVDRHHYSVPHRFARREVEVRFTARTVEIFLAGERIAVHMRGSGNGRHTTVAEHMPSSHQRYQGWTPAKIREDAAKVGPMLALLVERIIADKPHPEQGYRSCVGILGLVRRFGAARLEAAATRALEIGARHYPSVKSILEKGLDQVPVPKPPEREPILHDNIRGSQYYH